MNLGRMIRSSHAVDEFATEPAAKAVAPIAPVVETVTPTVVEKIVYVDKVIEKPVYIDRVVEVEKVVEVPVPVEAPAANTDSSFFDDFVPSEWAKEDVKENAQSVS